MDATVSNNNQADPLQKERAWLSAFLDGEAQATPANWARLTAADEVKTAWRDYHIVGDLLRASNALPVRPVFARKVMLVLDAQPTVLAPQKQTKSLGELVRQWSLPSAAIAAATAVVVWVAVPQFNGGAMTAKVPAPQNQANGGIPKAPANMPHGINIMPASVPGPAASQPARSNEGSATK
jgi:negative regulator of sigma E activity